VYYTSMGAFGIEAFPEACVSKPPEKSGVSVGVSLEELGSHAERGRLDD